MVKPARGEASLGSLFSLTGKGWNCSGIPRLEIRPGRRPGWQRLSGQSVEKIVPGFFLLLVDQRMLRSTSRIAWLFPSWRNSGGPGRYGTVPSLILPQKSEMGGETLFGKRDPGAISRRFPAVVAGFSLFFPGWRRAGQPFPVPWPPRRPGHWRGICHW